jgi:hypothetical protein
MRKKFLWTGAAALLGLLGFALAFGVAQGGAFGTTTVTKSSTNASTVTTITTVTTKPTTTAPKSPPSTQPQCKLARPQPEDPLELNTVAAGGQAKSIVMEKEIYECSRSNGGLQIRDVQTFIELFEAADADGVSVTATRVIATLCVKDLDVGTVRCSQQSVPVGGTLSKPLAGCSPSDDQPHDPVQMNSKGIGDWFKTITVEKEVLFCPNDGVSDLYLFTELVSDNPPTGGPTARSFGGIICVKHPSDGTPVDRCNRIATN